MVRLSRRGQTVLELAVFGSLMLILLGVILSYGQRLEFQQQLKMEAFRRGLSYSYAKNAPVTYSIKKDSRFFDLFAGFGQGSPQTSAASASVMWTKGFGGLQGDDISQDQGVGLSHSIYQINDEVIELPKYQKKVETYGGEGKDVDVYVPVEVWKEETARRTQFAATTIKTESETSIRNTQESNLSDTATAKLYYRFDQSKKANVADYVAQGERYGGTRIAMGRTYVQGAYLKEERVDLDGDPSNGNEAIIYKIEYSPQEVGTIIHRERTWDTAK